MLIMTLVVANGMANSIQVVTSLDVEAMLAIAAMATGMD